MDYTAYEEKMKKTIAALETEFASIRAGRANASVLDRISVEYYGSKMKINEVAQISSPALMTDRFSKRSKKPYRRPISE